jgi:uncharacterized membrane protein
MSTFKSEVPMGRYELTVLLHIAAAVLLLSGSVVASPAVRAAVRGAQTTRELRAYLKIGRPLLILEPASAIVILVTGAYLTSVANFWSLGWVQVSLVAWFVNAVVAASMVKPAMSRLALDAAETVGDEVGPRLHARRWSNRWSIGGDVLLANDAASLCVMTLKPEWTGALVFVVAANILVSGVRAARHGFVGGRWKVSGSES